MNFFDKITIHSIRSHSAKADELKKIPKEWLKLIYSKKYFKLFVPERDGGLMMPLPQALHLFDQAAFIDGNLGWAITIGIFIIIGVASSHSSNSSNSGSGGSGSTGASSSGSSSGNSSQAYNDCVTQYNSLKSQLDSVNAQETSYQSSGDTTDYNNLIPQQNSLVQQVNDKATECNGLR